MSSPSKRQSIAQRILSSIRYRAESGYYKWLSDHDGLKRRAVDADALLVLRYHNVGPTGPLSGGMSETPTVRQFEREIDWLTQHFAVVDLMTGVERLRDGKLGGLKVALTFDGGWAGVMRFAVPLLAEYKAPATLFVNTRFAAGEEVRWDALVAYVCHAGWRSWLIEALRANVTEPEAVEKLDWMPLTTWLTRHFSTDEVLPTVWEVFNRCWGNRPIPQVCATIEQLNETPRERIDIGSHSGGHYVLSRLDDATLYDELVVEHRRLASMIDRPLTGVSYPFGQIGPDFDERAVALVREHLHCPDFAADEKANVVFEADHPLHRTGLPAGHEGHWARHVLLSARAARKFHERLAAAEPSAVDEEAEPVPAEADAFADR